MTEKQDLERHLYLDTVILGIFITLIIFAGVYYFLHNDTVTINRTAFTFDQNKELQLQTSFNFTTTTLSAQNDVILEAITIVSPEYLEKYGLKQPEKFYLYITDAVPLNPTYEKGHIRTSAIELTFNEERGYYDSKVFMQFGTEGEKCYNLTTEPLKTNFVKCPTDEEPLVTVSSSDSKFQYEATKITIALTLIFLAFTILSAREVFAKMFGYYIRFDEYQKKKKDKHKDKIEDENIKDTAKSELRKNPTTNPDTTNTNDNNIDNKQ